MKRALTVLLLAATALGLSACKDAGPGTFNQDDGTHEMFKARTSNYPFDRKMTYAIKWGACRWVVDVQDKDGKRHSIDHGTETSSIFVPFVDGRRASVTQTSCGKVKVHNR